MLMARELGPGGTERQLTEMARALDPLRFQVHVGCFHMGVRADELRSAGIPVLRLPVTSFIKPSALLGAWQLRHYLQQHKIRLVHTFDYPLNCFGVPVARACGTPVVLSSQRFHRQLAPRSYLPLLRITDRLATAVVVNSDSVRQEMIQHEHMAASRVHLCYNGIDIGRFHPGARRRLPQFQDASLVVGVVCLLRPEKGLETLLHGFAQLPHPDPGFRLLIVGSGPELPGLQVLADKLNIRERCVFQPAVADVVPWLRSIDIFVLPSLSEALSNSLMEAMACGCACIASCVGGNPELVREGETGLLFQPGNAQELSEKLARLVHHPNLRDGLARTSTKMVRERFSLQASAARMEQIYSEYLL